MLRVHVICEGQTEELFVKELLRSDFLNKGIFLQPALIGKPGHKGGNFKFERLLLDVEKRLIGDPNSFCTTFFDYYGLPENFPGKSVELENASISDKSRSLCEGMVRELTKHLGENSMRRFIPFVQMYEFEALLFSDPGAFASGIDRPNLEEAFWNTTNSFETPEHINNSPATAPSKRVLNVLPNYEKPLMGSLAALEIGLNIIKEKCSLFNQWILSLEALTD